MKIMHKNWIYNIFLIFIILFSILAIFNNFNSLNFNNLLQKKEILIAIFFILFLVVIFNLLKKINTNSKWNVIILILIILIGLLLRGFSIYTMKTVQISDFAGAKDLYDFEKENNFVYYKLYENPRSIPELQRRFSLFPTWYVYNSIFLNYYRLFGFNSVVVKIANCILFVLSSILLYVGIKKFFNNRVALMTILCLSVCPALISYTNVATPDHFTILFMSLSIFLWSLIIHRKNDFKKYLISFFLILSLNLINLFKPLSIYMLLVFIGSEILINIFGNLKNIKNYIKENWKYSLYFVILFLVIQLMINSFINYYVEKNIKMPVVNSMPYYFLWGYSVDENGNYSSDYVFSKVIDDIQEECNYDNQCIVGKVSIVAKDTFKKNIKYLPNILLEKYKIAFSEEISFFNWANTSINNEKLKSEYYNKFFIYANGFMLVCYIMMIVTCIDSIIVGDKAKEKSIILLMIVGYTLILVLGGAQSRYKALIFPQLCTIFALGIEYLSNIFGKLIKKEKKC